MKLAFFAAVIIGILFLCVFVQSADFTGTLW